jgi:hypothetical protein
MAGSSPDVILTPVTTNGVVKWDMQIVGGAKGGYGNYPVLQIPKNHADAHLEFQIQNPAGSTWKFAHDSGALWVSNGPNDPVKASTDWQVPVASIHTINPQPPNPGLADTVLQFTDHNHGKPTALHYTLNFVDASNNRSSTLDPIMQNGGCCRVANQGILPSSTSTFVVELAIAFFVGIVITLIAQQLFRRA